MQKRKSARLTLADGSEFSGRSFGFECNVRGEVVFNTAMTGYPESLTDPSYKNQILVLTYPLIGNYGVPDPKTENGIPQFFESEKVQVSGLVISDYSENYSHWNAMKSLSDWLKEHHVPAISGVDTRRITKKLRENGTISGTIQTDNPKSDQWREPVDHPVKEVSTKNLLTYGRGQYKIVLLDCGVKFNIIRSLLKQDTTIIRVPWDTDVSRIHYDGLLISNGPGDPKSCHVTIDNIKKVLQREKPILGICLGHQLLALAAGGDTYKLKYGHRSHNQPVLMCNCNRAFITSQNHGYAVNGDEIPADWELWFENLNDGTIEGLKHVSRPYYSTQFHPEASGGPSDTMFLFDDFMNEVRRWKRQ